MLEKFNKQECLLGYQESDFLSFDASITSKEIEAEIEDAKVMISEAHKLDTRSMFTNDLETSLDFFNKFQKCGALHIPTDAHILRAILFDLNAMYTEYGVAETFKAYIYASGHIGILDQVVQKDWSHEDKFMKRFPNIDKWVHDYNEIKYLFNAMVFKSIDTFIKTILITTGKNSLEDLVNRADGMEMIDNILQTFVKEHRPTDIEFEFSAELFKDSELSDHAESMFTSGLIKIAPWYTVIATSKDTSRQWQEDELPSSWLYRVNQPEDATVSEWPDIEIALQEYGIPSRDHWRPTMLAIEAWVVADDILAFVEEWYMDQLNIESDAYSGVLPSMYLDAIIDPAKRDGVFDEAELDEMIVNCTKFIPIIEQFENVPYLLESYRLVQDALTVYRGSETSTELVETTVVPEVDTEAVTEVSTEVVTEVIDTEVERPTETDSSTVVNPEIVIPNFDYKGKEMSSKNTKPLMANPEDEATLVVDQSKMYYIIKELEAYTEQFGSDQMYLVEEIMYATKEELPELTRQLTFPTQYLPLLTDTFNYLAHLLNKYDTKNQPLDESQMMWVINVGVLYTAPDWIPLPRDVLKLPEVGKDFVYDFIDFDKVIGKLKGEVLSVVQQRNKIEIENAMAEAQDAIVTESVDPDPDPDPEPKDEKEKEMTEVTETMATEIQNIANDVVVLTANSKRAKNELVEINERLSKLDELMTEVLVAVKKITVAKVEVNTTAKVVKEVETEVATKADKDAEVKDTEAGVDPTDADTAVKNPEDYDDKIIAEYNGKTFTEKSVYETAKRLGITYAEAYAELKEEIEFAKERTRRNLMYNEEAVKFTTALRVTMGGHTQICERVKPKLQSNSRVGDVPKDFSNYVYNKIGLGSDAVIKIKAVEGDLLVVSSMYVKVEGKRQPYNGYIQDGNLWLLYVEGFPMLARMDSGEVVSIIDLTNKAGNRIKLKSHGFDDLKMKRSLKFLVVGHLLVHDRLPMAVDVAGMYSRQDVKLTDEGIVYGDGNEYDPVVSTETRRSCEMVIKTNTNGFSEVDHNADENKMWIETKEFKVDPTLKELARGLGLRNLETYTGNIGNIRHDMLRKAMYNDLPVTGYFSAEDDAWRGLLVNGTIVIISMVDNDYNRVYFPITSRGNGDGKFSTLVYTDYTPEGAIKATATIEHVCRNMKDLTNSSRIFTALFVEPEYSQRLHALSMDDAIIEKAVGLKNSKTLVVNKAFDFDVVNQAGTMGVLGTTVSLDGDEYPTTDDKMCYIANGMHISIETGMPVDAPKGMVASDNGRIAGYVPDPSIKLDFVPCDLVIAESDAMADSISPAPTADVKEVKEAKPEVVKEVIKEVIKEAVVEAKPEVVKEVAPVDNSPVQEHPDSTVDYDGSTWGGHVDKVGAEYINGVKGEWILGLFYTELRDVKFMREVYKSRFGFATNDPRAKAKYSYVPGKSNNKVCALDGTIIGTYVGKEDISANVDITKNFANEYTPMGTPKDTTAVGDVLKPTVKLSEAEANFVNSIKPIDEPQYPFDPPATTQYPFDPPVNPSGLTDHQELDSIGLNATSDSRIVQSIDVNTIGEAQLNELLNKHVRSVTGDTEFTRCSSGVAYAESTYNSGIDYQGIPNILLPNGEGVITEEGLYITKALFSEPNASFSTDADRVKAIHKLMTTPATKGMYGQDELAGVKLAAGLVNVDGTPFPKYLALNQNRSDLVDIGCKGAIEAQNNGGVCNQNTNTQGGILNTVLGTNAGTNTGNSYGNRNDSGYVRDKFNAIMGQQNGVNETLLNNITSGVHDGNVAQVLAEVRNHAEYGSSVSPKVVEILKELGTVNEANNLSRVINAPLIKTQYRS